MLNKDEVRSYLIQKIAKFAVHDPKFLRFRLPDQRVIETFGMLCEAVADRIDFIDELEVALVNHVLIGGLELTLGADRSLSVIVNHRNSLDNDDRNGVF